MLLQFVCFTGIRNSATHQDTCEPADPKIHKMITALVTDDTR